MATSQATTTKLQQNNELSKLCEDVLDFGDLLLIAEKSHGKTHALMGLARAFKDLENTRVFVFEDFPKWCNEFDALPFFVVKDSDVRGTEHVIDLENLFLRHERSYTVRRGREIQEFLKENKHGIFVMQIRDIDRSAFFIYSVVNHFYRKAYLRAFKGYKKHERIVFIIEESQNIFDSTVISKKLFNRLRKIFSVARNLGLHFVMCSQRLQDLNTRIRGRTRLLIGQIGLDDFELKISRLLRHSKYRKEVLNLPKGVFLYTSLDSLVSFPKFQQDSEPYQYIPKPHEAQWTQIPQTYPQRRKKRSLLDRILGRNKTHKSHEDDWEEEDNELVEEIDSSHEENEFTPI